MERKFYTDNFEQLLKEKSDEFRMYPSKRVWHSIYNDLHPGRKWPSIAVSMVLIFALLMTGYWNNRFTTLTSQRLASSKNIIASNTPVADATAGSNGIVTTADGQSTATATTTTFSNQNTGSSNTVSSVSNKQHLQSTVIAKNSINSNSSTSYRNQLNSGNNNTTTAATSSHRNHRISLTRNAQQPSPNNSANNSEKITSGENTTFNNSIANGFTKTTIGGTVSSTLVPTNEKTAAAGSDVNTVADNGSIIPANTSAVNNIAVEENATPNNTAIANNTLSEGNTTTVSAETKSQGTLSTYKKILSTEDKAWIDDYAFHNKSKRKKWQDRAAFEIYVTPSAGFAKLSNDAKYNLPLATPSFASNNSTVGDANQVVSKRPNLGLEAGFSISYSLAKKLLVKAGIQANITSYGINAYETNHPVLTTLMLLDPNSGYPYMHASFSNISNIGGSHSVILHNQTYQISIPLGFAFKLSGNDKLAWYTGATIQPTLVGGGKAYLISADRNNYVADASLIRKWNLNAGVESYITYKFDGFTFKAGPQFRQQLMSTYYSRYTVNEKLTNVGIKLGIIKNF